MALPHPLSGRGRERPKMDCVSQASFAGFHHIALTVRDLESSVRWYADVLNFTLLLPWDTDSFDRRIMRHPSGAILALTQHKEAEAGAHFDERRPGLDHLGFAVRSRPELEAWVSRFDAAGVEHSGIAVTPSTGFTLIAFRDPDNIQLELYLAEDAD